MRATSLIGMMQDAMNLARRSSGLLAGWCENPVPSPRKLYGLIENGSGAGATAAGLRIDFAHRPYVEPDPGELAQRRATERRSLPPMHTMLSLSLSLDHSLLSSNRVVDWRCEFDILANRRFISGSFGLGLDFPINFSSSALDVETRNRVAALMQRHPGFDVRSIMIGVARPRIYRAASGGRDAAVSEACRLADLPERRPDRLDR